ncbi:MAG: class I SAM-dependent methyltransferase [Candidatus Aminicenantes bacterium]|nr:MAG: class I SAM-dependent methyltransferase [Candidatus Aminicenantes bacterium]
MTKPKDAKSLDTDPLREYYNKVDEEGRLTFGSGPLELVRTQEILTRYLPSPPAVIGDVGGGAGIHALWLARKGYQVHLVDPVPKHIEQADRASQNQPDFSLASARVGDARTLDWEDHCLDALLFFGPLYHLTNREDRITALKEASRVTQKGGRIFVAFISRFASLMDGIFQSFLDDPAFVPIVEQDLIDGQHRNPTENPAYFTSSFFHHPDEIIAEVKESGLELEKLLAVESIGGLLSDFKETWQDDKRRERLLRFIRAIEDEPSLMGVSAHIIAIAKKRA